jgi:hypothetical protein
MGNVAAVDDQSELSEVLVDAETESSRLGHWHTVRGAVCAAASALEWLVGLGSLIVGLSMLAALPLAQFLTLGYFLESSGRVARTGRLRDGLVGVRRAARIGSTAAGSWLSLVPAWLVGSYARSAELIDPGGPIAHRWRVGLVIVTVISLVHIGVSGARGGRLRYFLWPPGNLSWLVRRLRRGGLYFELRDALWEFAAGLRLPYYFRLGLVGFLGTLAWLIVPAVLIGATGRAPLLGVLGALILAVVVPFLPFLQVRYAVEGRVGALFSRRAIRDRFRRAPWAFAFALLALLLAAIPLYLLKIEMIPREAAWLPSLVFVVFLAPARLLTGWAYARSGRRERPRHWLIRVLGRIAIIPAALLYVFVVFLSQYTSWGGAFSLYEQHAFLLPVPFFRM